MREFIGQAAGFGPPARRSHVRNDCNLVHHDRGILDEDGIGKFGLSGKRNNLNAEFGETILIRAVLRNGFGDVDRLSRVK